MRVCVCVLIPLGKLSLSKLYTIDEDTGDEIIDVDDMKYGYRVL